MTIYRYWEVLKDGMSCMEIGAPVGKRLEGVDNLMKNGFTIKYVGKR